MARISLNPSEVMEKLTLIMGDQYRLTSDQYGYRILRKTEENGDGLKGQVVFGSQKVNEHKRWGLYVFNHDLTKTIEDYLRNQGIPFDTSGYSDGSSLIIPAVLYGDLPTPKLEVLSSQTFNTHFDTNNVRVQTTDSIKNMVYFYFGKEQFARAELTSSGDIKEISRGCDVTEDELAKLAVSLAPEMPYKAHLMRRFDITTDDPEVQRYGGNYSREKTRLEKILSDYDSTHKLPGWETTDPRSHDSANFRYIVHAIAPDSRKAQGGLRCSLWSKYGVTIDEDLSFDPLSEPAKFVNRKYISCSVIDQAHYRAWSDAGFILKIPIENILVADSEDMGTIPSDDMNYGGYVPAAENILRGTGFGSYNEVLIHGTNPKTRSQIEVIGGFAVVDPITEKDRNTETSYRVRNFCCIKDLPLVQINYPLK